MKLLITVPITQKTHPQSSKWKKFNIQYTIQNIDIQTKLYQTKSNQSYTLK